MVDGIRKVQAQQFSTTGMKLSEIKENNELLFNYFKSAGYKEDAIIYSSDVERITDEFDANHDGKLSQKELKKMLGDDNNASRKERRAVRQSLETVKQNDLSTSEELLPEQVDESSTNYRNSKGELVYKEITNESGFEKIYPLNGSDIKIAKRESSENGVLTTTEYLDGEVTMPSKKTINNNGDVTTTEYKYDGSRLHTSEEVHGNDITFKKYRNGSDGSPEPTLVMEYKKGSQDQFKSYENKFDADGNRTGVVIENTGAYVKDNQGVLKEEITLTPEGSNITSEQVNLIPQNLIQSKTVTIQKDNNKEEVQHFKNFDGILHRIEKAEDGTEYLTVKMPQGWSVEKLATEFGVKKEDLLAANKAADGSDRYLTNSKGVQYFLVDQSVRINNPAKLSGELSQDRYLYGEDISAALPKVKHSSGQRVPDHAVPKTGKIKSANGVEIPANMELARNNDGSFTGKVEIKSTVVTYNLDANKNVVSKTLEKGSGRNKQVAKLQYNSSGKVTKKVVKIGNQGVKTTTYNYTGDILTSSDTEKRLGGDIEKTHTTYFNNRKTEQVTKFFDNGNNNQEKGVLRIKYWLNGKPSTIIDTYAGNTIESHCDEHGVKRYVRMTKQQSRYIAQFFYDQKGNELNIDPKKINVISYIANIAQAYRAKNDGSIPIS